MSSESQTELTWYDLPDLQRPLLLVAFEGLFDAAEAASGSLEWLRHRFPSEPVGMIDPERFFNFQESRPTISFDGSGARVIEWPTTEVHTVAAEAVADSGSPSLDLLVMTGVEPHLRWPTFADYVYRVASETNCEMVVTLGAYVGMVPHSRPFMVTGSAVDGELASRLQLSTPTYQGPTGVVGVINSRLERSSIPVVSLRVEVPHYVPGAPNPKAKQALLRRLQATIGVATGYEELDAMSSDWVERVDQAVASDDESRDYVSRLERQADSDESNLPSGDDLAAELEAFLRENKAIRDVTEASLRDVESGDVESGDVESGDDEVESGDDDVESGDDDVESGDDEVG